VTIQDIGKRILLDFFASFPWTGAIAREWDSIENNARFKQIEQEINGIWETVGKDPLHVDKSARQFLRTVQASGLAPEFQFRKSESCILLLKYLSDKSDLGQSNDPLMKQEECLQIIAESIGEDGAEKELRLAVYELEKARLIYKHASVNSSMGWHAIGPREYFFCSTDHLFQTWNPKSDAEAVIRFLLDRNEDAFNLEELDSALQWGPRRLNSAVAWLYMQGLIDRNYHLGGIKYVLPWMRLTEEAHLLAEQKQKI
jgi:hypothetical protein